LSKLSTLALDVLHDRALPEDRAEEIEALLVSAGASYGATVLAVVEPVQKLLFSALEK